MTVRSTPILVKLITQMSVSSRKGKFIVFWSHTHHKIGKLLTNIIQTSVFLTVVYY